MRIFWIGPPFTESALMGVGVVKPNEDIDVPNSIGENLVKAGRATEVIAKVPQAKSNTKPKLRLITPIQENS